MTPSSALLITILTMASMATSGAATFGDYSVQLRLTSLTQTPVNTTLVLHGIKKTITVFPHTTSLTFNYKMTSDQILDKEPILLDVSAVTDTQYEAKTVELDRDRPLVQSIGGLVTIVSSKSECAKNFFGPFCKKFCAANEGMHWNCTSEGEVLCMPGWQGPKCDERICPVACKRGFCDGSRCRCPAGFTGPACDQCIPSIGCLNGGCNNSLPGTCLCREGWTGKNCDIDLSMCSKGRSPCGVGATCIPKAPGRTECIYPEGKTDSIGEFGNRQGEQCPCKNGGSCLPLTGRPSSPICKCLSGFEGRTCEHSTVSSHTVPEAHSTIKFIVATNVVICSVVLVIGFVLIVVALRFIKSGRPCGGPAHLSDDQSRPKPQPKLSIVTPLMPDDLLPSPSSSPSKGDHLFSAAKEHSKKTFETIDSSEEPRYSACPKKPIVFSIPLGGPSTEKNYEIPPV